MKEDQEDKNSLGEIIHILRTYLQYLRKRWWMLVLAMLVGAGLGLVYYFIQKSKYEAVTTFILEEKSSGGSGLAGLASQFGFNLSGLTGGGSIFSGDNILDILKSKKIVQVVLLSPANEGKPADQSLADLYLDFSGLKMKWKKKTELAGINFKGGIQQQLSPLQDSILNVLYEKIVEKNLYVDRLNKKGSIIKVQVTASNEVFARLMTSRLVDEASKLYMDIRVGTSEENIRQLQSRSDSLLMLLNRKSFTAAAVQPLDINPAIKTAAVASEIVSRDKTVLATLYAEVTKNLEISKMLLSQQAPVIQVLDSPGYLLEDKKKSLYALLIGSIISFEFALIGGLFFFYFYNKVS